MTMKISAGSNVPHEVNVLIEIPALSEPVKYEFDKEAGVLRVDRFMATAMHYPANYGFIPKTLSPDGDPVDVLVVTPIPLRHGSLIAARPVGILHMSDEAGSDAKILAVPIPKLTALYNNVHEYTDLPELLIAQIQHFFEHYKQLEKGKWVKVERWGNAQEARQEIFNSLQA